MDGRKRQRRKERKREEEREPSSSPKLKMLPRLHHHSLPFFIPLSLSFSFLSLSSASNSSSSFLLHRCISPSLTQLLFTLLLFGYFFSPSLSSLSCLFFVFVTNLHFSPTQTQLIFFYFPFFFPFLSLLKQIVSFILFFHPTPPNVIPVYLNPSHHLSYPWIVVTRMKEKIRYFS